VEVTTAGWPAGAEHIDHERAGDPLGEAGDDLRGLCRVETRLRLDEQILA
jgi:hypothetical protein